MEDFNDSSKNLNNHQVSAIPSADGGIDDVQDSSLGSTTTDAQSARPNQTSDYSMSGQEQEFTDADQLLDRNHKGKGNTSDNQMNM